MKRAPFLGAGASLLLAGCGGGRSVLQMLPGVVSSGTRPSSKALQLVPQVADPISDSVLKQSLMGEARRFDAATAPTGWTLAQGQALNIADNRQLFSILGTIAGGDGRLTFKLPNPGFGVIVSVAGAFPTGPAFLAATRRNMTYTASLGPGAQPRPPRMPKPPSQQSSPRSDSSRRRFASDSRIPRRFRAISPIASPERSRMRDRQPSRS